MSIRICKGGIALFIILFTLQSCLEVNLKDKSVTLTQDDSMYFSEEDFKGTWEVPDEDDSVTGITRVELLADKKARLYVQDAGKSQEVAGTWDTYGSMQVGPLEMEYNLKIAYKSPSGAVKAYLGFVGLDDDQLVFSANELQLHKRQ